ncbi:MAG: glycosyltransferase family 2 protein [Tyzzerella sp.]|nr:glycosyltransferase family 2 protein [Tyzzerella sp.]
MNSRPLISVVMPIYNVEKHLEQAINSVLKQSFQDFELILVDDCSPDNCPTMCDNYAQQYEKIKVIHHEVNKGLSEARNTGLDVASGQYIWFMDSDDYVDLNLFECVHNSIQCNKAEIIVFGLIEEYFDHNGNLHHIQKVDYEEMYLKNQEDVRRVIIDLEMKTLYGYAWNKFYLLDYLKKINLRYEKVTLIEDILFNIKYCMDIAKMNILAITPYHYNKRMDNSLTCKFVPDYYELHRKRIELLYNQHLYWGTCSEELKSKLATLYARYIFSALQRNCDERAMMNHGQRKKWVQNVFREKLFNSIIPYGTPKSHLLKIMTFALKNKQTALCLLLGRVIFVIKNKLPMLFARAKQGR